MRDARADLLQGTLDMLILRTVAIGPQHGYGISIRIRQLSHDVLQVNQGSLYPALYRLERRGQGSGGDDRPDPRRLMRRIASHRTVVSSPRPAGLSGSRFTSSREAPASACAVHVRRTSRSRGPTEAGVSWCARREGRGPVADLPARSTDGPPRSLEGADAGGSVRGS